MQLTRFFVLSAAAAFAAITPATSVWAGPVSIENAQTVGVTGDFLAGNDGTAANNGVVDVYPETWSVAPGTPVNLKVRSIGSGYSVQIFRVGWYGGSGARELTPAAGLSGGASAQVYPTPDAKYGLAACGWQNSVSVNTTGFVPGLYVARVTQSDANAFQADTFFVVRDDLLAQKQQILLVIGFNTHEAYNAWPGMARGGKSLYAFNSSAAPVSDTNSDVRRGQAVKVSFDRPFLVGGGTADVFRWEYPMIRWLEKNGWEVAYALDRDLDANPGIMSGRKAIVFSGHDEYWSGQMFTNALAARDGGVNMLFVSGDTISWQVRFEDSYRTLVGYKENWPNDPMKVSNPDAVTRGFKDLPTPRPAIQLTGVMSSGQIKDATGVGKDFPYADLLVANLSHWIYAGTTLKSGDSIKGVMGYEVDSCSFGQPQYDPWRPPGQVLLGTITQPWDGVRKGSPCYYQKALGAGRNVEVIGLGAMAFTWALDDYAEKQGYVGQPTTVDANAQKMITNVLTRWTNGAPPVYVPPDAGLADVGPDPNPIPPDEDGGGVVPHPEAGTSSDANPMPDADATALDADADATVTLDAGADASASAPEVATADTSDADGTSAIDAAGAMDVDAGTANDGDALSAVDTTIEATVDATIVDTPVAAVDVAIGVDVAPIDSQGAPDGFAEGVDAPVLVDALADALPDGDVGGPSPSSGCGCHSAGSGSHERSALLGGAIIAALVAVRRRRVGRASS